MFSHTAELALRMGQLIERVKLSFPAKWLSKWHFLKAYRLSRIYMSIPDRSTPGIEYIKKLTCQKAVVLP